MRFRIKGSRVSSKGETGLIRRHEGEARAWTRHDSWHRPARMW